MPITVEDALYPRRDERSDPLAQALKLQAIQSQQEQQQLRAVQAQNALATEARAAEEFQRKQQLVADKATIWRNSMGPDGRPDFTKALMQTSLHQNPLVAAEAPEPVSYTHLTLPTTPYV